ncbi:immunity protein YezG family protein [Ningiella sp. W23]|uniref:immunity protein YezG family protein n=1 Tax=Ningiella sp. W23 TaxID=3023715 RepID=UPI0037582CAD
MNIDEIYKEISLSMLDNVVCSKWKRAFLDIEYYGSDALELGGGYDSPEGLFTSFKFRNFSRKIVQNFHDLHQITTENPKNNWNRAKFTLFPDGEFTIDFKWDQELADEIERLANED